MNGLIHLINYYTLHCLNLEILSVGNCNPIKSDDYKQHKEIWKKEGMNTFKDSLIYYNNLDTAPICIALKNFTDIYSSHEIDIFKYYVTLPGISRKMLFILQK